MKRYAMIKKGTMEMICERIYISGVELTQSDIKHILDLIRMNEAEGTYINGRKRWKDKNKQLRNICQSALDTQIGTVKK